MLVSFDNLLNSKDKRGVETLKDVQCLRVSERSGAHSSAPFHSIPTS